ncbi:MAG: glycosyltransferase [Treponema sp.]|jgi:glycosyltransferase involved in cell wall biosynthesis|nr:glycosyltransferase [Treponema sp.]
MKLSIITVNRNNVVGLEKTIQSVVCQTFADFEYIVIDGNSDDGSVDIIKKYADKITWWISEPDSGIYNAMNKGIRKSTGEYCLFLNSADCLLAPETLQTVFAEIDCTADIYYSNWSKSDGTYLAIPQNVDVNYIIGHSINHQNMLIRRSLFIEHGFYNETLRIVGDTEFLLKEAWIYKTIFVHINTDIVLYDLRGISTVHADKRENEKKLVFKDIFGDISPSICELYDYRTSIYGDIIEKYGNTKLLNFILKSYRYIVKRITRG